MRTPVFHLGLDCLPKYMFTGIQNEKGYCKKADCNFIPILKMMTFSLKKLRRFVFNISVPYYYIDECVFGLVSRWYAKDEGLKNDTISLYPNWSGI